MEIGIDVRPALSRPTGVGGYVLALARRIPSLAPAHRFVLFTASLRERWPHGSPASNARVADRHVPVRLLNVAWNRLGWPPLDALAGSSFDLVHAPHPLLVPARRARRIVTLHDLFFLKHPEQTRAEIRRDYAPLVRAHAQRADHALCVSQATADDAVRLLGLAPDRLTVVHNGFDPLYAGPVDATVAQDVHERFPLAPGFLLYVGSDEPRKNLPRLLAAHARLPDAPPLVLVGPPPSFARPPHVITTGYLPAPQIRALMGAAGALVLVSREEGFGIPVVEAMAARVPVVCADVPGLREIAGDAARLVDPLDEQAIADGLGDVLQPSVAASLRTRGRARSRAFDWDRAARETLAVYERVAGC